MDVIARDEQMIREYIAALEAEREGDRQGERVLSGLRDEAEAALKRQRGAVARLERVLAVIELHGDAPLRTLVQRALDPPA